MRCIVWVMTLFTLLAAGTCFSCAKAPPARQPDEKTVLEAKGPGFKMIYIRAASSGTVKELRGMPIDIVRIRPDPQRPPDNQSLAGGYIVEAVAPENVLAKLKARGFEFSEIPPRHGDENKQAHQKP